MTMSAFFIAIGIAIDTYYISSSHNVWLYEKIYNVWEKLDSIRIPDYPRKVSACIYNNYFVSLSIGLLLCTITGIIGLAYSAKYAILIKSDITGEFQPLFPTTLSALQSYLEYPEALLNTISLQILASVFSILITLRIMKLVSLRNSRILKYTVLDLFFGIALSTILLFALDLLNWFTFSQLNVDRPPYEFFGHHVSAIKGALWLSGYYKNMNDIGNPASSLYTASALLPSLIFHYFVLMGLILKATVILGKKIPEITLRGVVELGMISEKSSLSTPVGFFLSLAVSLILSVALITMQVIASLL